MYEFQFSALLVLIFILELAAGISGYVLNESTGKFLHDKLTKSMNDYQFNPTAENVTIVTKTWDVIQRSVSIQIF